VALPLQRLIHMVVVARPLSRPEPDVITLILSIETKGILLLDRAGTPRSSLAPALRVGYIATAVTVDNLGEVRACLTAPLSVDAGMASHHLANLAITQTTMRGGRMQTVGLIGDPTSTEIVRGALRDLRTAGECARWIEVLDPGLLRARLDRLMAVLEPSSIVRDEVLGGWDLALTFQPGGIDEVIGALERRRPQLAGPVLAATEAVLDFMTRHRARADYGTLRRQGIELPVQHRRYHEQLPLRMARGRCRPITVE